jgi:ribonuclease III
MDDDLARVAAVEAATGIRCSADRLRLACTHASFLGAQAGDRRIASCNERLEFLGDAVLGGAVCALLFERVGDRDEGHLTRLKSHLVSRAHLAQVADGLGILAFCRVGAQMGPEPAAWPASLKANLAEAILGAIFLDAGWAGLAAAVDRLWTAAITDPQTAVQDVRQRLQELCHRRFGVRPDYATVRDGGTEHAPIFTSTATIAEHAASGSGLGRRRAEAAAAEALLALLAAPSAV